MPSSNNPKNSKDDWNNFARRFGFTVTRTQYRKYSSRFKFRIHNYGKVNIQT